MSKSVDDDPSRTTQTTLFDAVDTEPELGAVSTETETETDSRRTAKVGMAQTLERMGKSNADTDLRTVGRRIARLREEGLLDLTNGELQ